MCISENRSSLGLALDILLLCDILSDILLSALIKNLLSGSPLISILGLPLLNITEGLLLLGLPYLRLLSLPLLDIIKGDSDDSLVNTDIPPLLLTEMLISLDLLVHTPPSSSPLDPLCLYLP